MWIYWKVMLSAMTRNALSSYRLHVSQEWWLDGKNADGEIKKNHDKKKS